MAIGQIKHHCPGAKLEMFEEVTTGRLRYLFAACLLRPKLCSGGGIHLYCTKSAQGKGPGKGGSDITRWQILNRTARTVDVSSVFPEAEDPGRTRQGHHGSGLPHPSSRHDSHCLCRLLL